MADKLTPTISPEDDQPDTLQPTDSLNAPSPQFERNEEGNWTLGGENVQSTTSSGGRVTVVLENGEIINFGRDESGEVDYSTAEERTGSHVSDRTVYQQFHPRSPGIQRPGAGSTNDAGLDSDTEQPVYQSTQDISTAQERLVNRFLTGELDQEELQVGIDTHKRAVDEFNNRDNTGFVSADTLEGAQGAVLNTTSTSNAALAAYDEAHKKALAAHLPEWMTPSEKRAALEDMTPDEEYGQNTKAGITFDFDKEQGEGGPASFSTTGAKADFYVQLYQGEIRNVSQKADALNSFVQQYQATGIEAGSSEHQEYQRLQQDHTNAVYQASRRLGVPPQGNETRLEALQRHVGEVESAVEASGVRDAYREYETAYGAANAARTHLGTFEGRQAPETASVGQEQPVFQVSGTSAEVTGIEASEGPQPEGTESRLRSRVDVEGATDLIGGSDTTQPPLAAVAEPMTSEGGLEMEEFNTSPRRIFAEGSMDAESFTGTPIYGPRGEVLSRSSIPALGGQQPRSGQTTATPEVPSAAAQPPAVLEPAAPRQFDLDTLPEIIYINNVPTRVEDVIAQAGNVNAGRTPAQQAESRENARHEASAYIQAGLQGGGISLTQRAAPGGTPLTRADLGETFYVDGIAQHTEQYLQRFGTSNAGRTPAQRRESQERAESQALAAINHAREQGRLTLQGEQASPYQPPLRPSSFTPLQLLPGGEALTTESRITGAASPGGALRTLDEGTEQTRAGLFTLVDAATVVPLPLAAAGRGGRALVNAGGNVLTTGATDFKIQRLHGVLSNTPARGDRSMLQRVADLEQSGLSKLRAYETVAKAEGVLPTGYGNLQSAPAHFEPQGGSIYAEPGSGMAPGALPGGRIGPEGYSYTRTGLEGNIPEIALNRSALPETYGREFTNPGSSPTVHGAQPTGG